MKSGYVMPTRILPFLLSPLVLLLLTSCEPRQNELRLVAPSTPSDREIAEELSGLLAESHATKLVITDVPQSAEAAVDLVAAGDADVALVTNSLPFRDDIETIMPLYPTVLHIAYRKDRDATSATTLLRGAKVYAGPTGSASRLVFERLVSRFGFDTSEYEYASELADDMDIIVLFASISPDRLARRPDFRLFSLDSADAIGTGSLIDAGVLLNPHFQPFVIPAGTYGQSTPGPVVTIAVDKLLVTRSDLDSSVVYDLINDILRLRPALAARRPGLFQVLTEDFDASRSRFILHAGTQDYLQRDTPTFMERYSGIAEVIATLLVGLVSLVFAAFRLLKMRRKNLIDTFYLRVHKLRRSITNLSSAEERQGAADQVRELQSEAFDLLIDEKLSADESFQIFITLSNDVLKELGAMVTSPSPTDR